MGTIVPPHKILPTCRQRMKSLGSGLHDYEDSGLSDTHEEIRVRDTRLPMSSLANAVWRIGKVGAAVHSRFGASIPLVLLSVVSLQDAPTKAEALIVSRILVPDCIAYTPAIDLKQLPSTLRQPGS